MHVVLFLVGIVLAFAGAVLMRFVVPIVDVGSAALFTAGTMACVGGLILIGLAAAVRALNRIAERLEIQPLPLPPVAAVGREDPAPRPARQSVLPANTPAGRPSLLGWFGRGGSAASPAAPSPAGAEPAPPVDLSPLTRVPEEPRVAPPVTPVAPVTVSPPVPKPVPPPPRLAVRPPAPPAPATPETTVYKSGVIDGMAYTLFMDGSIEAELPQGKVKFASVDELQKYLTTRT
jgi:hypothetical protein